MYCRAEREIDTGRLFVFLTGLCIQMFDALVSNVLYSYDEGELYRVGDFASRVKLIQHNLK